MMPTATMQARFFLGQALSIDVGCKAQNPCPTPSFTSAPWGSLWSSAGKFRYGTWPQSCPDANLGGPSLVFVSEINQHLARIECK